MNHRLGVVAGIFHFSVQDLFKMSLPDLKFWYDRAIAFMKWTAPKRK
ncbi:MAG: GpE family phage tail protein [Bacteroidales bacterium]|nr:GpE family phage tail protein [Bacteroidales bacterium]